MPCLSAAALLSPARRSKSRMAVRAGVFHLCPTSRSTTFSPSPSISPPPVSSPECLAGLFGIGGGTVLVPAFFEVFGAVHVPEDVRMHLALGSSMAIVVSTSLRSFTSHQKRGTPDVALLKKWVVAVPLGVLAARCWWPYFELSACG